MAIKNQKIIRSIVLIVIIVGMVNVSYLNSNYELTAEEIEDVYMQTFEENLLEIRDKVVIEDKMVYFYEAGENRYGSFVFKKGFNGRYSHESIVRSEKYYQERYLTIGDDNYVVIVGMNPFATDFYCEINGSTNMKVTSTEDFMIIFNPPPTTELPLGAIEYLDINGRVITDLVKVL